MRKATYRGASGVARIREADWKAVGVTSKDVTWSGYGDAQEVANEAAEHLAAKDERFEVEGAGDDSAYARRLTRDTSEQANRERVSTRGALTTGSGESEAETTDEG